MVHRDIKPANILFGAFLPRVRYCPSLARLSLWAATALTTLRHSLLAAVERGGAVVPVLADLGLACALKDANNAEGTPVFQAPEVLRCRCQMPVGDVWALGATLWVMFLRPRSGERVHPYVCAGAVNAPRDEILGRMLLEMENVTAFESVIADMPESFQLLLVVCSHC